MNNSELERIAWEAKAESVLELLKENQRLRERVGALEAAAFASREALASYVEDPSEWTPAYIEAHQVAIGVLDEHFWKLLPGLSVERDETFGDPNA